MAVGKTDRQSPFVVDIQGGSCDLSIRADQSDLLPDHAGDFAVFLHVGEIPALNLTEHEKEFFCNGGTKLLSVRGSSRFGEQICGIEILRMIQQIDAHSDNEKPCDSGTIVIDCFRQDAAQLFCRFGKYR